MTDENRRSTLMINPLVFANADGAISVQARVTMVFLHYDASLLMLMNIPPRAARVRLRIVKFA